MEKVCDGVQFNSSEIVSIEFGVYPGCPESVTIKDSAIYKQVTVSEDEAALIVDCRNKFMNDYDELLEFLKEYSQWLCEDDECDFNRMAKAYLFGYEIKKTSRLFITVGTQALCFDTVRKKYYFAKNVSNFSNKIYFSRKEVKEAEEYLHITGLVDIWDRKKAAIDESE
ncbi:hypothetical protein LFYK43_14220 [Ligilactobacillus salitolerans]|uniref:DUF1642 domain-containing protein n=1 Tax=Ligilactobacillus salitolerans TaxID=1808352 RepID=A0A401ITS9_9LACO|nr:hypothetical protein [Ligilactobacillus salitolerans]GBG94963.1 hypothetical protein LFYK43_14220 [Ligilactobacillus salitolerans]